MTQGTLGIIACPMLEDELIYNLRTDVEEKYIYLVKTDPNVSIKKKLERYGLPYQLIDEYDLKNGFDQDSEKFNIVIYMNRLGLHAEPKDLRKTVEDQITMLQSHFDVLALYYGLCGNAGWDITKWAADKFSTPVIVFRDENDGVCDDCIGVAVGGTKRYYELNKAHTGQLYLTPAMATNWNDFLSSSDMFRGTDTTDHSMMRMILEMCGYQYALQIDTGLGDKNEFDKLSQDLGKEMNLKIIQAEDGWATLGPANRIYANAKTKLSKKD